MSPGETAEAFGWGPLLTLGLAVLTSALGYGASAQRNKRVAEDLDKLEKDHGAQIKEARAATDQVDKAFSAYKEIAREKFVITDDLRKVEKSLSDQIQSSHSETTRKVEELRVEFGKKGIEHTINSAITKGMAQALSEIERKRERAS